MKLKRIIAIGVIAGSLGIHAAGAKTLRNTDGPAEFPPASYKGKQYVDSQGCVYIRAGIDGHVNWVPRVSRDRKVICGFKPTLAGNVAPATANPAKQPVQITNVAPAPRPAPAVKPMRRVVAAPQVVTPRPVPVVRRPAPVVVAAPRVVAAPQRPRMVAAPQKPMAPRRERVVAQNVNSCPGLTGISGALLRHNEYPVRCGPQAESPTAYTGRYNKRLAPSPGPILTPETMNLQGGEHPRRFGPQGVSPTEFKGRYNQRLAPSPGPIRYLDSMNHQGSQQRQVATTYRNGYLQTATPETVGQATRVVRRHVAEQRSNTVAGTYVPNGYRPAWQDDRLNTRRTNGTFIGKAQMELVWTKDVPRRLIDRKTGQDVTAMFPQMTYPNTGIVVLSTRQSAPTAQVRPTPQTVTRTATQVTPPAAHAGLKRDTIRASVQVGTYRDAAAAQRIARKVQRLGLPVRIGILRRGGEELRIVVSGPYASQSGLTAALGKVQRAGYRNAVIRQ